MEKQKPDPAGNSGWNGRSVGELMKMWMVFVRADGRKKEVICWLPASRTRKGCIEMMERRNQHSKWKDMKDKFVIRRVNIEVEY